VTARETIAALLRGTEQASQRIPALRLWIASRIAQCRIDEAKFKAGPTAIEAARERMTLLEVLRILDGEVP
jgi:hypothetical protein